MFFWVWQPLLNFLSLLFLKLIIFSSSLGFLIWTGEVFMVVLPCLTLYLEKCLTSLTAHSSDLIIMLFNFGLCANDKCEQWLPFLRSFWFTEMNLVGPLPESIFLSLHWFDVWRTLIGLIMKVTPLFLGGLAFSSRLLGLLVEFYIVLQVMV